MKDIKRLVTSFLILVSFTSFAQSYIKQYSSSNISGTAKSNVSNNRIYISYIEDSASVKVYLVLQKNDLAGNILWRKRYNNAFFQSPGASSEVVRVLNFNNSLIIGCNRSSNNINGVAFLSIDTTAGSVNYFNVYTNGSPSDILNIYDCTMANSDVVAVGRQLSGAGNLFYLLRFNASTGSIINNGFSTFSTNQIGYGVCYLNGSVYSVGVMNNYPFLAKLKINGASIIGVACKSFSTGFSSSDSFTRIQATQSGSLSILGGNGGINFSNQLLGGDTTLTSSAYAINGFQYPLIFQDIKSVGNKTYAVSSITTPTLLNAIHVFTNATGPGSITVPGYFNYAQGDVNIFNNQVFYQNTTFGSFTTFSPNIVRGDSLGVTPCSSPFSPMLTAKNYTATNSNIGVFATGSVSPTSAVVIPLNTILNTKCSSTVTSISESSSNYEWLSVMNMDGNYRIISTGNNFHSYTLMDVSGKILLEEKNINSTEVNIKLENYAKGLYYLTVNTAQSNKASVIKLLN